MSDGEKDRERVCERMATSENEKERVWSFSVQTFVSSKGIVPVFNWHHDQQNTVRDTVGRCHLILCGTRNDMGNL